MGVAEEEIDQRLVDYISTHGDDLGFTKFFWRGCEPLPRDIENFTKFAKMAADFARGIAPRPMKMGVGLGSSQAWAHLDAVPKLGIYLKTLLRLGMPTDGRVWLTMETTHGYANPIGQFIHVPEKIDSWRDIEQVLAQIVPLSGQSSPFSVYYIFGFFVGMVLGDAHKPKQGHAHRNVHLVLSKRYDTNIRIGDFTTLCANLLGLRMQRNPDIPKPDDKPFGFYVWVSQSSPFIDWIFNVVLGLKDGQHTTYDQVDLDWALEAPHDFRLGLLHGIAESDGSVSVASQTVEFWVIPDWDFMIKLLATFGLSGFRNREAVSLVKSQAIKSFTVPVFSPQLKTVRYGLLELMATKPKLERKDRLPVDVRHEIIRLASEGMSIPKIVVEIAKWKKLLVSFEAAQRWANKSGRYSPRSLHRDEDVNNL